MKYKYLSIPSAQWDLVLKKLRFPLLVYLFLIIGCLTVFCLIFTNSEFYSFLPITDFQSHCSQNRHAPSSETPEYTLEMQQSQGRNRDHTNTKRDFIAVLWTVDRIFTKPRGGGADKSGQRPDGFSNICLVALHSVSWTMSFVTEVTEIFCCYHSDV